MSLRRRFATPADRLLPRGGATEFLVALVGGVIGFFIVLALALALAAGRLADQWSSELADVATLQVFAGEDAVEAQARAALDVLRNTEGVRSIRIIEVEEQQDLLAPWFGAGVALDAAPLPLLIEVEADRGRLDRESLERRLAVEAPGAVYDDHSAWRAPLVAAAERLRVFAFSGLALMTLALSAAVSLAAIAAVAANSQTIETLRLVGARDGFISGAFTRRLTLKAGGAAALGALAGLALLAFLPSESEQGFFLVGVGLKGAQWLAPSLAPLACAAIAWIAARVTARAQLRRWS